MKFRDLKEGDTFDFVNDQIPGSNSFFKRCEKISSRKYKDEDSQTCTVGTINAEVYHVEKYKEIPPEKLYFIDAYKHVLKPFKKYNNREYAEEIKNTYDICEARNKLAYETIRDMNFTIRRVPNRPLQIISGCAKGLER